MPEERYRVKVGETFDLELNGLGCSGYVWIVDPTLNLPCSVDVKHSYKPLLEKWPKPGSSTNEVMSIKSLLLGECTLRFHQLRLFEKGKAPIRTREVTIEFYGE